MRQKINHTKNCIPDLEGRQFCVKNINEEIKLFVMMYFGKCSLQQSSVNFRPSDSPVLDDTFGDVSNVFEKFTATDRSISEHRISGGFGNREIMQPLSSFKTDILF